MKSKTTDLPTLREHFKATSPGGYKGTRLYPNPQHETRFVDKILKPKGLDENIEMRLWSRRPGSNVSVAVFEDGKRTGFVSTSINPDYFVADPSSKLDI